MALKQLMQMAHQQGLVMAFADVFFMLTLLFVALAALAVMVKKPPGAPPRPCLTGQRFAAIPTAFWHSFALSANNPIPITPTPGISGGKP